MVVMSIIDESYKTNLPYITEENYRGWLESFTIDETMSRTRRPKYSMMLAKLWTIPYRGLVGNDRDREEECMELRNRYASTTGNSVPNGQPRVLEMLIALSMRMFDVMQDTGVYNSVSRWFWEIVDNIGIGDLDDDFYVGRGGDEVISATVREILLGSGRKGQKGGWFYLPDWQDTEIWYQMNEYLKTVIKWD